MVNDQNQTYYLPIRLDLRTKQDQNQNNFQITFDTQLKTTLKQIKVLCEQTREVNKLVKGFFGLCLILSGLGNIVVDFHF